MKKLGEAADAASADAPVANSVSSRPGRCSTKAEGKDSTRWMAPASIFRCCSSASAGFHRDQKKDLQTHQGFWKISSSRPVASAHKQYRRTPAFNRHGVWAIYKFQMARALRCCKLGDPVITTSCTCRVRRRVGSRLTRQRRDYGAFIVPGAHHAGAVRETCRMILPAFIPEVHRHLYELLSAPVSLEIVMAYVGAA